MDTSDKRDAAGGAADEFNAQLLKERIQSRLQSKLKTELDDNRLPGASERDLPSGGLAKPLVMASVTLLLAFLGVFAAYRFNQVREESYLLNPTDLFRTEGLLIEALKERTDLEIGKRDQLIAKFQAREEKREAFARSVLSDDRKPIPGEVYSAEPTAKSEEDIVLEALVREANFRQLFLGLVGSALDQAALRLGESDYEGARAVAAELDRSAGQLVRVDSASSDAVMSIADSLTGLVDNLEDEAARVASLNFGDDEILTDLQGERDQRRELNDRLAALQAELDALRQERAASGAASETEGTSDALDTARREAEQAEALAGRLRLENARLSEQLAVALRQAALGAQSPQPSRFLGSVSVIDGQRIVIDLSGLASAKAGDPVFIFRANESGGGTLVALAYVSSIDASSADLSLTMYADQGYTLQLRDAAYRGE